MDDVTDNTAPKYFIVIAVIAVLWNLLGVMAFVADVTMSEEALGALPVAQQELYTSRPAWALGAFAIAVFAGLAGSIALVLKHAIASTVLGASLVAVVIQNLWGFAIADTVAVMGPTSLVLPATVFVIGAGLLVLSFTAKARGWLR